MFVILLEGELNISIFFYIINLINVFVVCVIECLLNCVNDNGECYVDCLNVKLEKYDF